MAVPEQTPYIEHIANGVTTSFVLEFECKDKEHLIVSVDNVEPNVGTWSLVNGAVVFGIAPENGKIITIQRNTPFRRDTNFQSYDNSLRPATINKDFDWVWFKLQELGVANWLLKNYVDRKDDELKAYLVEEIHKQGVALDQLDDYYNYLMQRLAQIAVDKGWDASFVVDASGKTQQEVNDEQKEVKDRVAYIQDFGGAYNDFDPSVAEAEAKAVANPSSKPYDGARQFAFPMRTLKVWNYCDGYLDRGAVASIRNVSRFNSAEPRTEVLGIGPASQLAQYVDRDVVGLYIQTEGQPALLTSNNTTFTSTTVTCTDLTTEFQKYIRKDQIIDIYDGSIKYSGRIISINNQTITIDTAWYKQGTTTTGTPNNGSTAKFVPNTKIWAGNFNVVINPDSDANDLVGIELGTFNSSGVDGHGVGYDIWSGGTNNIRAAFQARGRYQVGLELHDGCNYGMITNNPNIAAHIVFGGNLGYISQDQHVSFLSRGSTSYSFAHTKNDGELITGINEKGFFEALRYSSQVVEIGGFINQICQIAFVTPTNPSNIINLPSTEQNNTGRIIHVKNLSQTNSVYLAGAVELGTGSIILKAKECLQLFCDGDRWFPISNYIGD